jgi:hypothetical protein
MAHVELVSVPVFSSLLFALMFGVTRNKTQKKKKKKKSERGGETKTNIPHVLYPRATIQTPHQDQDSKGTPPDEYTGDLLAKG